MKHFKVTVVENQIEFGQEVFSSIQSFLRHFDNCPLIGDDTGQSLELCMCSIKYFIENLSLN